MTDKSGEELIALAGTLSFTLADTMSIEELAVFAEFFGLLRHNLDIIRIRRVARKIEEKIEKVEEKKDNKNINKSNDKKEG